MNDGKTEQAFYTWWFLTSMRTLVGGQMRRLQKTEQTSEQASKHSYTGCMCTVFHRCAAVRGMQGALLLGIDEDIRRYVCGFFCGYEHSALNDESRGLSKFFKSLQQRSLSQKGADTAERNYCVFDGPDLAAPLICACLTRLQN